MKTIEETEFSFNVEMVRGEGPYREDSSLRISVMAEDAASAESHAEKEVEELRPACDGWMISRLELLD